MGVGLRDKIGSNLHQERLTASSSTTIRIFFFFLGCWHQKASGFYEPRVKWKSAYDKSPAKVHRDFMAM